MRVLKAGRKRLNTAAEQSDTDARRIDPASAALILSKEYQMNNNTIDEAELDRLRIKRVPIEVFVWGDFRYSNASDAIAAARRAEKK